MLVALDGLAGQAHEGGGTEGRDQVDPQDLFGTEIAVGVLAAVPVGVAAGPVGEGWACGGWRGG